jgi:hypothetical protein
MPAVALRAQRAGSAPLAGGLACQIPEMRPPSPQGQPPRRNAGRPDQKIQARQKWPLPGCCGSLSRTHHPRKPGWQTGKAVKAGPMRSTINTRLSRGNVSNPLSEENRTAVLPNSRSRRSIPEAVISCGAMSMVHLCA